VEPRYQATLVRQLTGHYGVAALGFDISFPEADTSSGYAVLQGLAHGELAGVAGLPAQLEKLRPAMDYDGLFADAMRGQPVVLGYSVSGARSRARCPGRLYRGRPERTRRHRLRGARLRSQYRAIAGGRPGAGIFTALTDADGVVRSSTLLTRIGDGYYPRCRWPRLPSTCRRAPSPLLHGRGRYLSARQLDNAGLEHMCCSPRAAPRRSRSARP
jgi:adenylate cyclase